MPFVVTFATPAYCESRTCGPTVDVVEAARKRFEKDDIRFIHVEIYARPRLHRFRAEPAIVSPETVWYAQVVAFTVGHVAGLAIAHDRAVALFEDRRDALRPQLSDARADGAVHGRRVVAALPWKVAHGGTAEAIVESLVLVAVVAV